MFLKLFKRVIVWLLTIEARAVLLRHRPEIIAVTGSVGKTSAKEAIWTLLKEHFDVWKSEKSYNSEIGVPLAILGLRSAWNSPIGWLQNLLLGFLKIFSPAHYPGIIVLEMGLDRPGDFDRLLGWVKPHIAVVTAIGKVPVHVEFFKDPEALVLEKAKLPQSVEKDGWCILNSDDETVFAMARKTSAGVLTYGFGRSARVRGSGFKVTIKREKPEGIAFKIDCDGKSMPVRVSGIFGKQSAYALLAAAAVG
ncbi:MAG: hypothetical protein HYT34_01770, partial [Candidatus Ryanbacteria bacterium]|nr:hypothetical protein [Candidatus Ryanbacteria bacterium]